MYKILVFTALLSLILASCGTFQVSIERVPSATATESEPVPSATQPSATAILPTATLPVTGTPPSPTRIRFAPGGTQSITEGRLGPGESSTFVLAASQGQVLIASADSPDQDVDLSISGANRAVLLAAGPSVSNSFTGTLPATQDYLFKLTGGASPENFALSVIIAARIQFAPGEKESIITGRTNNGFAVTYSAYAQKGQTMDVTLDVPGERAGLTIWGFSDGEPYARAQNGVRDFSLVLPSTQDYIIEVQPQAGQTVDYTLTVQIQ